MRGALGGDLLPQLAVKSSYSRATTRSEAVRISCSRSFSSWVMYRSPFTRVCLRM